MHSCETDLVCKIPTHSEGLGGGGRRQRGIKDEPQASGLYY